MNNYGSIVWFLHFYINMSKGYMMGYTLLAPKLKYPNWIFKGIIKKGCFNIKNDYSTQIIFNKENNEIIDLLLQNNETTCIGIGALAESRVLTILSRNISRAESDEFPSLIK